MQYPSYKPGPQPCICKEMRGAEYHVWCSHCGAKTNECIACMEEPPCDCLWIAEDHTDARGCELHDQHSHYNRMIRAHARQTARKAAAHTQPVFDAIEQFFLNRRAS